MTEHLYKHKIDFTSFSFSFLYWFKKMFFFNVKLILEGMYMDVVFIVFDIRKEIREIFLFKAYTLYEV